MDTPDVLWIPSVTFKSESNLGKYMDWLAENHFGDHLDYNSLWEWSVKEPSEFWESIWDYFEVTSDSPYHVVCSNEPMPNTRWFDGARLNFAEHIFRKSNDEHLAILSMDESGTSREINWKELKANSASIRHTMKKAGLHAGDRVAAYIPNIPEATMAMLATVSLGAIWTSTSPDFGVQSVMDRFQQVEPKIIIATTGYQYGGKRYDRITEIRKIVSKLPSVELVIIIPYRGEQPGDEFPMNWIFWEEVLQHQIPMEFTPVPFDHPLWILFSSGTTGLPKAITHSHGGILLELLKYLAFHNDAKPGERFFWYTTTGWMMWNYLHGCLLHGCTMVLYDGSPAFPDLDTLWELIERVGIHHFGTSAGFILANLNSKIIPRENCNLSTLRSIGSTGSTLPPEGFDWVYRNIKNDVWLHSISGGTDVCTAFVGGNPLWPVYKGEIQCRALGCSVEAYNEAGIPLEDEVGEMVITKAMPSMPVFFWNDPGKEQYQSTYFDKFPGVWCHGDWIKITSRKGLVIYGRSDATLNRGGVRIGTSEIYRAVSQVSEVDDSLIICIEERNGHFYMPLFVKIRSGYSLNQEIIKRINETIRSCYSPRHVPDEIIQVEDIPYTISGKKMETPVKLLFMGKSIEESANAGSMRNPESLDFYKIIASDRNSR